MTGALWSFWNRRGHLVEGMSRLVTALDADPRHTPARGKALNAASELSGWTGQHSVGRRLAAEALSLHRSLGDDRSAGWSAWALGLAMAEEGDFEEARNVLEQSIGALSATGAEEERLVAIRSLAWVLKELGDHGRARTLSEEGLVDARAVGSEEMESTFLGVLATTYAEEDGRVADALSMLERSIQLMSVLGDRLALMVDLSRIARVLSVAGRPSAATQILSRADELREEMGVAFEPWNVKLNERTLEAIHAGLDEKQFREAWAAGRRLTVAEAVALGLAGERAPAA
jgi:tetratricopeptide (TPR) repeat protein